MLTHPSKKVLKALRRLTRNTDLEFTRYSGEDEFTLLSDANRMTSGCSKYAGQLSSIIDLLISDGYIQQTGVDCYRLSQAAIHAEYFQTLKIHSILLLNVVLPICVSLATTLITLYINGLLSKK